MLTQQIVGDKIQKLIEKLKADVINRLFVMDVFRGFERFVFVATPSKVNLYSRE